MLMDLVNLNEDSDLSRLPTEIFTIILQYVGGLEFLQLRKTCKRLKDVADNLEATARPALWHRYLFSDYERPVLESLDPLIYVENKDDPLVWKSLYVSLRRTFQLMKAPVEVKYRIYDTGPRNVGARDIIFCNRHLFLIEQDGSVKLVAVDGSSLQWPNCCWFGYNEDHKEKLKVFQIGKRSGPYQLLKTDHSTVTLCGVKVLNEALDISVWKSLTLPPPFGQEVEPISAWTNYVLLYIEGRLKIANYYYEEKHHVLDLNEPVDFPKCASFNDQRVVLLENPHTICIIPITSEQCVHPVFHISIGGCGLKKLKMIGDFLVVLCEDGLIQTAEFTTDSDYKISLHKWNSLLEIDPDRNETVLYQYKFVDFALQGQCFAAVTAEGTLCLSHLKSLNHSSLLDNLTFPLTLNIDVTTKCTGLAMDLHGGLKLAVMQPGNEEMCWTQRLHMVYVEK